MKNSKEIFNYFKCAPCIKPKPHFLVKPIHHTDIKHKQKLDSEIEDETELSRQKRCEILLEKEDKKQEILEEERKIAIFCDAHQLGDKTPQESQRTLEKLVKELNKKENEIKDPCKKISYHIRNDGKIIRKKMVVPNCDKCL